MLNPFASLDFKYHEITVIHAAESIQDLRSPPGNHLEKLKGDRAGQYSIRVNNQLRICFVWHDNDAYDVEIEDYR
ncbi:MAG: type II toxin-antitoxin system RelE/ParE family toxin [Anaerolineales bacterium]|nr:type II toxin-antitoxin system RelE/ParE family toxin [Anaerolineales bacterium]